MNQFVFDALFRSIKSGKVPLKVKAVLLSVKEPAHGRLLSQVTPSASSLLYSRTRAEVVTTHGGWK